MAARDQERLLLGTAAAVNHVIAAAAGPPDQMEIVDHPHEDNANGAEDGATAEINESGLGETGVPTPLLDGGDGKSSE